MPSCGPARKAQPQWGIRGGDVKGASGARRGSCTGLREPAWVIVRSTQKTAKGRGWDTRPILQKGYSVTSWGLAPLKETQRHKWKENVEKISRRKKK